MSQKSWYVLRIVAGLYLMYLGIQIIRDLLSERPEDMMFKAVIAVVFVIVGAAYGAYSAKNVWKMNHEVQSDMADDEDDAENAEKDEDDKVKNSNLKIAEDKKMDSDEDISVIEGVSDFEDDADESGLDVIDEEEK